MRNWKSAAMVAGICTLAALVGCGPKGKACKVAERTEAEVLAVWSAGGMKEKAEEKRGAWAAGLEAARQSNMGPAQTVQSFVVQFSAVADIEDAMAKKLTAQNADMKAGKPVAENSAEAMRLMMLGPRDGKTPEQRAADYAPKIQGNERKIEAHKKASVICRAAVQELKEMVR